eukprot:scaffold1.g5573.t1
MGYAGYVPAKYAEKRTPLQQALEAIPSAECLEVLYKLSYNTAVQPTEDKFRTIRLSNAKIKVAVADVPGAVELLTSQFGWDAGANEAGEPVLTLPKGTTVTMQQVRTIQDAQAALAKKEQGLKRSRSAAALPGSEEQQRLREQIEADRRERAARDPVTKASVAQALPSAGANITSAGDLGLTTGGGCDC